MNKKKVYVYFDATFQLLAVMVCDERSSHTNFSPKKEGPSRILVRGAVVHHRAKTKNS